MTAVQSDMLEYLKEKTTLRRRYVWETHFW